MGNIGSKKEPESVSELLRKVRQEGLISFDLNYLINSASQGVRAVFDASWERNSVQHTRRPSVQWGRHSSQAHAPHDG